ncbi:putative bifunctional diguanylate cyclase/phosphodiesterase [Devosia sp.]|uniref:putative bifunctional diguanylate cyclase/phosphodiesterase n=1 Tax=Devosia sp. TaxID=1871048 RepID=UPI002FCB8C2B
MIVNPVLGLVSAINGLFDRAIGAAGLSPQIRGKLLRQQLDSVGRMMPVLVAASLVVVVAVLALTWRSVMFWPLLVVGGVIGLIGMHSVSLAVDWRHGQVTVPPGSASRSVIYSAVLGTLWGVVVNMLPIEQDGTMRGVAAMGVSGLLCIAMMALVNYPQALAAFAIPLVIGGLAAVLGLSSSLDMWMHGTLLIGLTLIMAVIARHHAAAFVAHRGAEALVKEKGEIIGLLLREFEQGASDWIWGFDAGGAINSMSAGFTTATGVPEAALMGADFVDFLRCITPPNDPLMTHLERDITGRQTFQDVELRVTADGRECWWSLTGKPAVDESGNYTGYVGTGSDVTERKAAERRIALLAHHDSMTGLLNRTKFTEQLNSCVARLERYGTAFSILFLDLDQFKAVNDSRGHMAGDRLLVQVAKRMQAMVRETDFVARLGGDEFAIILPNDGNVESASGLATRLIEQIGHPYLLDGEPVSIGVSIGIAIAPLNGTRSDQILRNADLALYRAKADGRSVFRFFESQMDSEARQRRLLEVELRDALLNNELLLYYQPVVAASDESPIGFEALIRWNHPSRGLVPPAEFIPIAEQSGLIVDIGDWTIQQACMAAATWPEHLTVAVNVSANHFRRADIALIVQKALAISGLAPQRLEIEITEGLLLEKPDEVIEKLGEIRALGVAIAMDDFGTGYSSLSHLTKFPFDKIKIDRAFVGASCDDAVSRDTLKAIALMGRTLGLTIAAEGVETKEQADFLSAIACQQLQGFYFSRPLDSMDLPHYLLTHVLTQAPALKAAAEAKLAGLAG